MKHTITETGGLYWLQHSPPKSLLKLALGTPNRALDFLRNVVRRTGALFARMCSLADEGGKSFLVVGSAGEQCISPCLQRLPRRSRRLVVLAR